MSKHINVMAYAYETQRALKKGRFTVADVMDYLKTDDVEIRKVISSVLNQAFKRIPDEIQNIDTVTSPTSNRMMNVFKITPAGADVIKNNRDKGLIETDKEALFKMLNTTNSKFGRKTNAYKANNRSQLVIPQHEQRFADTPSIDNMSDIAESLVNSTTKLLHQNKYYRDLLLDVCMKLAGALDMKVVDKNFQAPTFFNDPNGDLFAQGENVDG